MSENENQEFSLEDIIKEFSDHEQEIPERTSEEILEAVEGAVLGKHGEQPEEEPQTPAADTGDTIRFEKITTPQAEVRNAMRIEDEEEELPQPEPGAEPYSEEWEPEYEQPIAEYEPAKLIQFRPRSRLRELKKKLVEGPERLYYNLSEKGLGKIQVAIALCLLVVLISAVATALQAFGVVPESRLRFMVFWQFLAMLISALLGCYQLIEGVADVFKKRFSLNSLLVFTFVLCCVDGVICFRQQRIPCCAAFGLQVAMSLWKSYEERNTRLGQLDTMRKATRLDSITAVEDYYEGTKGLLRGEGQVEDFMDTLDSRCKLEKTQSVYALIALGLSVVSGVLSGILHGVETGIQVATVTSLASVPASMFIAISRPMAVLERRHHKLGTVLCGWQGVEALSGKAAFPVSHEDLFPVGTVKMNGVKFYGSREPDEIVSYTTAVINADGGSLTILFNHLLDSRNGRHYTAENFKSYEEGGIGAEVCGEAVLAGSIEFLKAMGVEVPEGIRVNQAVCVAVDGELCGLFAITYEKDRAGAAGLATLSGYRGLHTVITTDDFMLTEEFIRSYFDVKTKRIRFPEYEERSVLREKKPEEGAQAHALITGEGLAAFAYAVTGARALKSAAGAGTIFHMIGGGMGIAMMLVLGFLGATELLTPAAMFLYELVLMVPGLLITEWTRSL